MDFFEATDYRMQLKKSLLEKRKVHGVRYSAARMASHCLVQSTYLSKALNQRAHLSEDQTYAACQYLKLNKQESEYLLLLRRFQKCKNEALRSSLKTELEDIRKKYSQLANVTGVRPAQQTIEEYFLDPLCPKIHLLLTIDSYSKSPIKIAPRLGVTTDVLEQKIAKLREMGLVADEKNRLVPRQIAMHLPKESSASLAYRSALRIQAASRIMSQRDDETFFSVGFTASEKTKTQLKKMFDAFIKDAKKLVDQDAAEDVFVLNFDLFRG